MIAKIKARGVSCSFCGRSSGQVANIVAGTPQHAKGVTKGAAGKSAFICNECVERYRSMMANTETPNQSLTVPK